MWSSLVSSLVVCYFSVPVFAQSSATSSADPAEESGYSGYNLTRSGNDTDSAIYETANTGGLEEGLIPDPDVHLYAKVHVGEIDVLVQNLSAQVNLDAQVLQLLEFNAGVDVSINRVYLTIQNVTAEVLLEARLENVVTMVSDVLDSIDLNPVLATLGQTLGNITDGVGEVLEPGDGGSNSGSGTNSTLSRRSADIPEPDLTIVRNILYSVNNFSGNRHTNRILAQDGTIVEQSLDNDGRVTNERTAGDYKNNMSPTGRSRPILEDGVEVTEYEYLYAPLPGVEVVSAIHINDAGEVLGARVLSEAFGGGSASIDGVYTMGS